MTSGFRNSHFSTDHDLSRWEFAAIDVLRSIVVWSKRGTLQRNAGKQTACARIAQDFRAHIGIRIRGSVAPYGACCPRGIAAQFHFAAENRIRTSLVHYEQHEVGGLSADLESNAAPFQRKHRWSAPTSSEMFAGAANHSAAAIARSHHEPCLQNGRKYNYALSLFPHLLRDIVGNIHNLFHHAATFFQPLLFLVCSVEGCR